MLGTRRLNCRHPTPCPSRRGMNVPNVPKNQFSVNLGSLNARWHVVRRSIAVRAEAEDDYDPELDAMDRMEKSLLACEDALSVIRTGRAQPAMLNSINVDYYGAPTPLQQLASITAPDAQTIMVNVYDKGALAEVESAIQSSDLGFNPNNDGNMIRINVPPLTEERRKEMTKLASAAGEDAKVSIRNVRRDVLKKMGKLDLSEDDKKGLEGEIQTMTDSNVKKIDEMVAKKNKDLTTV